MMKVQVVEVAMVNGAGSDVVHRSLTTASRQGRGKAWCNIPSGTRET
jgi:hypothetical protein